MKFLLQYWSDRSNCPPEGSPEAAAEFQAWMKLERELAEAGVSLSGHPLTPPNTATSLRRRAGKVTTTDGPFAETKEVLGGYHLIEVENLDRALEWAEKVPTADYGTVEVRPILELPHAKGAEA